MSPVARAVSLWGLAVLAACAAPAPAAAPAPVASTPEPPPVEAPAQGDESVSAEAVVAAPAVEPVAAVVEAPKVESGPRIGSLRAITWIYDRPSREARQIGYLREGTSAPLASAEPVKGTGCPGGWYALAPYGNVCLDRTATLDLKNPRFVALAGSAPRNDQALPYRYAFSKNAPMYNRLPTAAEQLKVEGPRERWVEPPKLSQFLSGHEELAVNEAITATDKAPEAWKNGAPAEAPNTLVRKWIPHGAMLAFSHAFEAQGRVWLLSPDQTIVPADRVKPFRPSTFRGVTLEGDVKLPMAWSRHDPAVKYRKGPDGLSASTERWSPRTAVALTGERVEQGTKVFWATSEPGVYALEGEVTVARPRDKDKMPANIEAEQRWLDVHIRAGTLVAYVGQRPVFATLISPGAGGFGAASASNEELVKQSATPLGIYRITWKTRAAVMTPEKEDPKKFWIADVPHTQYFRPPFAIHTAYWHEDFGMPKSAGCINVSPEDGRFLFQWTDTPTQPTWQGSGPGKGTGLGSLLVIAP